jgi:RNA polymerase sigma-70 factor (ECF subfamily)
MQGQRVFERVLTGEVAAGDVSFASLFAHYHGPITSYLYRLTGSRETADDLTQETFLKAFRALARTDPDVDVRAWLFRIATNTAVSHHRRQRLLTWLPFSPGMPEPADDSPLADALGEQELVAAALRAIGQKHAGALLLRHHLNLSVDETAAALGVSANTAKVRLHRARKAFASAWHALDTDPITQPRPTTGEDRP